MASKRPTQARLASSQSCRPARRRPHHQSRRRRRQALRPRPVSVASKHSRRFPCPPSRVHRANRTMGPAHSGAEFSSSKMIKRSRANASICVARSRTVCRSSLITTNSSANRTQRPNRSSSRSSMPSISSTHPLEVSRTTQRAPQTARPTAPASALATCRPTPRAAPSTSRTCCPRDRRTISRRSAWMGSRIGTSSTMPAARGACGSSSESWIPS